MVRSMTKDALLSAFAGESMAHMRYLIFADIAERRFQKCFETLQSYSIC
ncbi:MAG: ferritin family protein [Ignisphaera sp.]